MYRRQEIPEREREKESEVSSFRTFFFLSFIVAPYRFSGVLCNKALFELDRARDRVTSIDCETLSTRPIRIALLPG